MNALEFIVNFATKTDDEIIDAVFAQYNLLLDNIEESNEE